ncbi:MAG: FAD-dependent monooxygenase [Hyphomicrobiales bacterium]|nr:FAD-dependent monooxygenase [Hyphomicrobiales bacterium]
MADSGNRIRTNILVAGAGATGLIAAIALARAGHSVALVGVAPPPLPGRTVALFEGSLRLLDDLGLRDALNDISADVRGIRIIDDTSSIFRPPPAVFEAGEIGLDAFGLNITNDDIVARYAEIAAGMPAITRYETLVSAYDFRGDGVTATLADGRTIDCALVVAGDGRNSLARKTAAVGVREWSYPQTAITGILRHRRPHGAITTEFHTRQGPFTFVPMAPLADAPNRSSLVWLMAPGEAKRRMALEPRALAAEIEERSHYRFGAVEIEGKLGAFPMACMRTATVSAPRLMLVGEACHVFPPLAAQGLNLGIRDSTDAALALDGVDLADARAIAAAVDDYERARRADIDIRTRGVDLMNRSLLADILPVDLLRGATLAAVTAIGPLRRAILREGITPSLARSVGPFIPRAIAGR